MKVLTIDSTEKEGIINLAFDNKIYVKKLLAGESHSEFLLAKIEDILLENNLTIKDINVVSVNLGPGSFTGVRIGVSFVKAFMLSLNLKAVVFNSFDILSYNIKDKNYIAILNSNNEDIYFKSVLDGKISFGFMKAEEINNFIKENKVKCYCKKSESAYFKGISKLKSLKISDDVSAKITLDKIENEEFTSIENINPLYIKKSQAERELKEKINKNLVILKATINDVENLLNLEDACFTNDKFSKQSFVEELTSNTREYYIASVNNKPVGYIGFIKFDDGINLIKVCVLKEYREFGIASKLIEKMIEKTIEYGYDKIFLEVDEKNEKAIKLYEKYNFETQHKREKYYANGNSALIMFKYLNKD